MEFLTFPVLFLLTTAAGGVGYLAATVAIWALKRSQYRLECDVTDLQNSLLSEIKKRAGQESAKSKKADDALIQQLAANAADAKPKPNEPWWLRHVHPDLRSN